MLEVHLENGDRVWLSVFALRTVKHGTVPDTAHVTWADGTHSIVRENASALVRRIRIEMAGPGRV